MASRLFAARGLVAAASRRAASVAVTRVAVPMAARASVATFATAPKTAAKGPKVSADQKLAKSLQKETEEEDDFESEEAAAYLAKNKEWKVYDDKNDTLVILTKKHKDETVKVIFEYERTEDAGFDEEEEFEDEEEGDEHKAAEEGEDDIDGVAHTQAFQVTITKDAKELGALVFECYAVDGRVTIGNVIHSHDASIVTDKGIKANPDSGHLYTGPDFLSLAEDVQTGFYAYLEERGIDSELATFLPEYTNVKENKSYLEWLKNIQTFVNAN